MLLNRFHALWGKAVATAGAGDVIAVRAGTYTLTTNITVAKNGTAAKPITLTNSANEVALDVRCVLGEPRRLPR